MADFKDQYSGKQFRAEKYSSLSSSLAASSDGLIDGRKHEFLSGSDAIAKLPYRIKKGDQAKYFPGLKEGKSHGRIETGSIVRDTVRGIVYVPIKKKNYQENLIGVDSHISSAFTSSAYLEISAAFADKFSGVDGDALFTFGVEEFYSTTSSLKSSAINVGSLVASFNVFASGTLTSSFSALDLVGYGGTGKRLPNFTFNFPESNFITHFEFKNGISGSLENIDVQFGGGNGAGNGLNLSASVLTDSPFVGPASGTLVASEATLININGTNTNAGKYVSHTFKTKVAGDADSGSLYDIETQFPGAVQIVSYPRGQEDLISSGSFQFHATNRALATGSSDIRTLYFISGSDQNTDYGFFVTSSTATVTNNKLYTPVHKDIDLRTRADKGFYSPSGSQYSSSIQVGVAGGVTFGPHIANRYQSGN